MIFYLGRGCVFFIRGGVQQMPVIAGMCPGTRAPKIALRRDGRGGTDTVSLPHRTVSYLVDTMAFYHIVP